MKILILILMSLMMGFSANASTLKTFDADALFLLNSIQKNCKAELSKAMKGAQRIGEATYISPKPVNDVHKQEFTLTTVRGGHWPEFKVEKVNVLKISRAAYPPHRMDAPLIYETTCDVSPATK